MSPSGEEELSEAITIGAAFVFLALSFRFSGSSNFRFFPDFTGTLPLAATNPDWILAVSILTSLFFFLSMICQGVRDIHKYFLFFIISFLSIFVLMNIPTNPLDTCLEMVLRSATILLRNLVRKVLANEPPNTELFKLPRGVSILLPH